jgi:hypothetical protein
MTGEAAKSPPAKRGLRSMVLYGAVIATSYHQEGICDNANEGGRTSDRAWGRSCFIEGFRPHIVRKR